MRRKALGALVGAFVFLASMLVAVPAQASTQVVGFRVGAWHCPKGLGLGSLTGVDVSGTDVATLNMSGRWRGSTTSAAQVRITGVPPQGGKAWVVLTFWCWGGTPSPAQDYRWIYGSGQQPTYTI
ncbi:hypothetical protein ACIA8G_22780 [Lentzea sp. NPDC051213]|uniref:hypothetical protein n=1 Tax=Lentzea sp. NPDC051213 TaxID=3364126 RepID=UPI0037B2AF82